MKIMNIVMLMLLVGGISPKIKAQQGEPCLPYKTDRTIGEIRSILKTPSLFYQNLSQSYVDIINEGLEEGGFSKRVTVAELDSIWDNSIVVDESFVDPAEYENGLKFGNDIRFQNLQGQKSKYLCFVYRGYYIVYAKIACGNPYRKKRGTITPPPTKPGSQPGQQPGHTPPPCTDCPTGKKDTCWDWVNTRDIICPGTNSYVIQCGAVRKRVNGTEPVYGPWYQVWSIVPCRTIRPIPNPCPCVPCPCTQPQQVVVVNNPTPQKPKVNVSVKVVVVAGGGHPQKQQPVYKAPRQQSGGAVHTGSSGGGAVHTGSRNGSVHTGTGSSGGATHTKRRGG